MAAGARKTGESSFLHSARLELLFVAVISALLVAITFLTTDRIEIGSAAYDFGIMDHHRYIAMAQNAPFDYHLAPFSWRVLVPLLVKLQPFGIEAGFLGITLLSLWLCGIVVYYLITAAGFAPVYGLFALLLFSSLGWVVKYNIYNFRIVDSVSYLFVILAVYAIYSRRDLLFVTALFVGVLAKENVLFVVPLYYTLQASKLVNWRLLIRTLLLALPALAALLALRIGIPQRNGDPAYLASLGPHLLLEPAYELVPYSLTHLFQTVGLERLRFLTPYNIGLRYLLYPLGFAPLVLPLLAFRRSAELLLRYSPFLALVYIQLLFARNTERLLALAFLPLLVISVAAVDHVIGRLKLSPWLAVPLPLALFLLTTINRDSEWAYLSLPWQIAICAVFLAFLGAIAVYRRARPETTASSAA